jgi:hypothetical protein
LKKNEYRIMPLNRPKAVTFSGWRPKSRLSVAFALRNNSPTDALICEELYFSNKQKEMTKKRLATTLVKWHPGRMHRLVEPPVVLLCIPSGLHPSTNALSRFAAHQPAMDGIHSAGM